MRKREHTDADTDDDADTDTDADVDDDDDDDTVRTFFDDEGCWVATSKDLIQNDLASQRLASERETQWFGFCS